MLKRYISALLVIAMMFTLLPLSAMAGGDLDISAEHRIYNQDATQRTERQRNDQREARAQDRRVTRGGWSPSTDISARGVDTPTTQSISPAPISSIFPDTGLARVVADELAALTGQNVTVGTVVNQTNLDWIYLLDVDYLGVRNIQNLQGLQHVRNLQGLLLHSNQISNLQPLSGLQRLVALDLFNNRVQNLAPLAGLTTLEFLDLDNNQVSYLGPLANLTRLVILWLDDNQIHNVQPLSNLRSLLSLTLADNQVNNIAPLSGLTNLEQLWLYSNQVNNIAPLSGLTNLLELDLGHNQVSNLSPLANLRLLEVLFLDNNRISDLRPLNNMPHMQILHIGTQTITALPPAMVTNGAVSVESPFFHPNGARIAPVAASLAGGMWQSPNIHWSNVPNDLNTIDYIIDEDISVGGAVSWIESLVTVNLSDTPFHDVVRADWFSPHVVFVSERGVMSGTNPTTFAPNMQLNRAMLVTMLWNLMDQPAVTFQPMFNDVAAGEWYSLAVTWAADLGLVSGVAPGQFAPGAVITREQFVTLMRNFAEHFGIDVSAPATALAAFNDTNQVSGWALDAMRWAVYSGIVSGTTATTLAPQNPTIRAQGAALFTNYLQEFGVPGE